MTCNFDFPIPKPERYILKTGYENGSCERGYKASWNLNVRALALSRVLSLYRDSGSIFVILVKT